jgi:hypothetical protein
MEVECPYCHRQIDDGYVRQHVAKQLGASKSPRKKKDPQKMAELGKMGAEARWAKRKKKEQ